MDDQELSEFNSNKASLIRVDNLIKLSTDAEFNEDYLSQFKWLKALRKEALYKMRDKGNKELPDRKECEKLFEDLEKKKQFFTNHPHRLNVKLDFMRALDKFDVFLRDFMGKKGMLLKDVEDMRGL